jgi:hypothetical protein
MDKLDLECVYTPNEGVSNNINFEAEIFVGFSISDSSGQLEMQSISNVMMKIENIPHFIFSFRFKHKFRNFFGWLTMWRRKLISSFVVL